MEKVRIRWGVNHIDFVCIICGKKLVVPEKSNLKRKYCSPTCSMKGLHIVLKTRTEKCLSCGELFIKNGRKRYCGHSETKGTCSYNHRQERKKITNQKFLKSEGAKSFFKEYYKEYRKGVLPRFKFIARQKVYQAVRSGKLIKSLECEVCSKTERLQAHHEDYSKPLEVNWLCGKCHNDIHHYK